MTVTLKPEGPCDVSDVSMNADEAHNFNLKPIMFFYTSQNQYALFSTMLKMLFCCTVSIFYISINAYTILQFHIWDVKTEQKTILLQIFLIFFK